MSSLQDQLAAVLREGLPELLQEWAARSVYPRWQSIEWHPGQRDALARSLAQRLVEKLPGLRILDESCPVCGKEH